MGVKIFIKTLLKVNFKTLRINFKYFPFSDAVKLPIWVSRNCYISAAMGQVIINGEITPGMITIGYGDIGVFDRLKSRSKFQNRGTIIFDGKANIGHGCKLDVGPNGTLKIGNNVVITAETAIICNKHVSIGNNCLLSWQILIIDDDFHKIKDKAGVILNPAKAITIGNNVWIGCRCLILKGTNIGDGNVIAANATLTKTYTQQNSILTGGKVLKQDIVWEV
ncbi:acyltransferase [Mucilaginibacter antarcticus]|uniref:Acyltransferase n=1 Tax=Mucilaginibacter antarcticus TaxID=1855725 RepID=A0ABW5XMI2_9SPHI